MAITATLNGTITIADTTTGQITFTKILTSLAFTGNVTSIADTASIPNSPTSISLPNGLAQFIYIKNTHATQTLTVTWTPNGGASNVVVTLQAGAAIELQETNGSSGISALSLNGSASGTTVEYILVG